MTEVEKLRNNHNDLFEMAIMAIKNNEFVQFIPSKENSVLRNNIICFLDRLSGVDFVNDLNQNDYQWIKSTAKSWKAYLSIHFLSMPDIFIPFRDFAAEQSIINKSQPNEEVMMNNIAVAFALGRLGATMAMPQSRRRILK